LGHFEVHSHRTLKTIQFKKVGFYGKKWPMCLLNLGKIKVCGDKMESRSHLVFAVSFSSWTRWLRV
jgi:hypothetical protein